MVKLFAVILAVAFLHPVSGQEAIPAATFISSPVIADGDAGEWSTPLRFYDSNSKLFYGFANDSSRLYICFQAKDPVSRQKLLRAGLKVSVSLKVGTNRNISISYPLPTEYNNSRHADEPDTVGRDWKAKEVTTGFLDIKRQMELRGFANGDGVVNADDSSGINAAIGKTNEVVTCELSIPFSKLFGEGFEKADLASMISIEVEMKPVKKMSDEASGHRAENFGGAGRRGRMGGGEGNHFHRQEEAAGENVGAYNREGLYEKSTFRQTFMLSAGK